MRGGIFCAEIKLLFPIDWLSFALGFLAAGILFWIMGRVLAWLKSIFPPSQGKPFRQRLAAALRNLIAGVLVLTALALAAYIAYSVLIKPAS